MPTYIKKDAIVRLFESNGFKLVNLESGTAFVFMSKSGFSMEFPVKWLDGDENRDYELSKVRHVLNNMALAAKEEEAIYSFMRNKNKMTELFKAAKDYGLSYDEKERMFIYKKTKSSKSALFVAEIDFVIAARLKSEKLARLDKNLKPLPYKEIFDELKESAEQDKKARPKQEKVEK
jgi:hypothetical protein